jgi:hypothetical protein
MPRYELRYFIPGLERPVCESVRLDSEDAARARAASELLRAPDRLVVEVWRDERLVWRRSRGRGEAPGPV